MEPPRLIGRRTQELLSHSATTGPHGGEARTVLGSPRKLDLPAQGNAGREGHICSQNHSAVTVAPRVSWEASGTG